MMNELLSKFQACDDAKEWAKNKTWEEVYTTCERGDWLLWLFQKTNPEDSQLLTLAKGHCANTVRHLMQDQRSKDAVDVAIGFGEGKATQEELDLAASAAASAYAATVFCRKENQLLTAEVCRKYLPLEVWNIPIR